jgi:hypothetical protein
MWWDQCVAVDGGGVHREVSGGISARGIVIARGGDAQHCYACDHKRQTVLNTYDATVVTQQADMRPS